MLIPIVLFAATFGILYIYFTSRSKERLALIEKGSKADIFYNTKTDSNVLKFGVFLLSISLGILKGYLFVRFTELSEGVAYSSMILLFAGLSLIVFYFIDKTKHPEL